MVLSKTNKKLIAAAQAARKNAYAPYSKFRVGAAVLVSGGKIFSGCNVENASYGLTICAERSAIALAVSQGEKKILAVAVVGGGPEPVTPCGACRQVLLEFGPNAAVLMVSPSGKVRTANLSALLPSAFAL